MYDLVTEFPFDCTLYTII